jgi:hypothetical protein
VSGDDYVPLRAFDSLTSPHLPRIKTRDPWEVWAIVPLPVLIMVAIFTLNSIVIFLSVLIVIGASYLLASNDRRQLDRYGYERLPSALLALVPVVYLALRCSRKFDRMATGMRPFWIHLGLAFLFLPIVMWGGGALDLLRRQHLDYGHWPITMP